MKKYILCTILVCLATTVLIAGCASTTAPVSRAEVEVVEVADEATIVGGYTEHREPDADEIALFNFIMTEDYEGAIIYTPISVKTQVVAGINYTFLAMADPQIEGIEPYEVDVIIYQPLTGDPVLTEIIMH